MNKFDYDAIPDYTREAIRGWVTEARPTGGFLHAVLTNDLNGAVARADGENIKVIPQIVCFLYNRNPAVCWGSPEAVEAWPAKLEEYREKGVDIDALFDRG